MNNYPSRQTLPTGGTRAPVFLTPLKKHPGETPEAFARRALGQAKRALARQAGIVPPHQRKPQSPKDRIVVRIDGGNPDHHLWNNNGTWWIHYTVHRPDHTALRIRRSLKTGDIEEARRLRDQILEGKGGTAS